MNIRNQVLLIKAETTRGTDAVPDQNNDALECGEITFRLDKQALDRVAIRKSISALKREIGQRRLSFSFPVEVKGSSAAGTAPDVGPALQGIGAKETITPGSKVEYQPEADPADMKSVTIHAFFDGIVVKAVGCVGNVTVEFPPGGIARFNFEFEGKFSDIADAALPAAPVYQNVNPVQAESVGLSFGSFNDAVVRSFSLSSNNTIARPPDLNESDGVAPPEITSRDPSAVTEIDAVLEATSPFWGDLEDRDTRAVDLTIGTIAGNIVKFDMAAAAIDSIEKGNADGKMTWKMNLQLCESADNAADNYKITFQ